ncbi:hypothetical protein [Methyloversatilis universalis]|uniref:hypothetical protein n=1 Tax=Methyloversatilis universalis TaxID=378211 RepID=UPI0003816D7D|nr:hypothetical protein [Methyloversatilis universalis]
MDELNYLKLRAAIAANRHILTIVMAHLAASREIELAPLLEELTADMTSLIPGGTASEVETLQRYEALLTKEFESIVSAASRRAAVVREHRQKGG